MRFGLLAGLMAGGLSGCGQGVATGDIEKTVPAGGVLTYEGQPLKHHQVTFFPTGHRAAAGVTNEEGQFVLGTNAPGDGAVVARHRVSVTYVGPPDDNPESGVMDFPTPPPPDVKIPRKYGNAETSDLVVEIPEKGDANLAIDLQ